MDPEAGAKPPNLYSKCSGGGGGGAKLRLPSLTPSLSVLRCGLRIATVGNPQSNFVFMRPVMWALATLRIRMM
jgi:hypothetical protein